MAVLLDYFRSTDILLILRRSPLMTAASIGGFNPKTVHCDDPYFIRKKHLHATRIKPKDRTR